jgi:RimJ/RimL family protein N-acetyltransferase
VSLTNKSLFHGNIVRLTSLQAEDALHMFHWYQDATLLRNLDTDIAFPPSLQEIQEGHHMQTKGANSFQFGIRSLENNDFLGFAAIHSIEWNNQTGLLAIGIGDHQHHHKGYGTDALQLILRYAFHELNFNRVGLDVIEYNKNAIHLYNKLGFQVEGRMRSAVLRDGKKYDRIIMGILREEWESNLQTTPSFT